MASKNSLILWRSMLESTDDLTDAEIREIWTALARYLDGAEITFKSRVAATAWKSIELQLNADKKRYAEKCRVNSENKKAYWDRIHALESQTKDDTNLYERIGTNTNENEPIRTIRHNTHSQSQSQSHSHNIIKEKIYKKENEEQPDETESSPKPSSKRFVPPTVEEVKAYAAERQYAGFNAEAFVSRYTANGWKVGRNPMKDWKAAVRYWTASNNSNNLGGQRYGNANNRTSRNTGTYNELSDYSQFDE